MSENSESSDERTAGEKITTKEEVRTIAFRLREIQRLLSIRIAQENRRLESDELEPVSLFCDRHVVVLAAENVVPDMAAAFDWMATEVGDERESAIIATGLSATADMGARVRGYTVRNMLMF